MLVILIAVGWIVLATVGLSMGRLAARSDRSHAHALANWFAVGGPVAVGETLGDDTRGQDLGRRGSGNHEATG